MKTAIENILLALILVCVVVGVIVVITTTQDRTFIALKRCNCELEILKEYLETNPNATVLDYANRIQKDCWMKGGDKT